MYMMGLYTSCLMQSKVSLKRFLLFIVMGICLLFISCNTKIPTYNETEEDSGLTFEYSEKEDGYIITQFVTNNSDVVIPEVYNNKNVYAIAPNVFADNSRIHHVKIPSSIKEIGEKCFYNCINLKSITIESKDDISIGQACFMGCTNLISVEISGGLLCLPDRIFAACTSLESVTLPDSLTIIGERAFVGCASLISLDIPDSVSSIGEFAFMNCSRLQSISLPESLEAIANNTFSKCTSLFEIYVPATVTTIDCSAFSSMPSLERIEVDTDNPVYMSVDGMLVGKETAELLLYPSGKIEDKLILPSSITLIGEIAFRGDNKLRELILHDGVTEIKNQGGIGCIRLESLVILSHDVIIHPDAFYRGGITYKNGIETNRTQYTYPFTIFCLPESTSTQYAENNNITFELIEQEDLEEYYAEIADI